MITISCLLVCWNLRSSRICDTGHQPGWPMVVEFLEYLEFFWNWKSRFFRVFLEFFFNSGFSQSTFWVTTFSVCLYLDLLFVIIHYFIPVQSDFNNRPSHQFNCRPSLEPDVILKTDIFVGCPFIGCYHYRSISCFWEWKRTGAEIVPFVVMWSSMLHVFYVAAVLLFLFLLAFTINLIDKMHIIFKFDEDDIRLFVKVTEKCIKRKKLWLKKQKFIPWNFATWVIRQS